MKGDDISDRLVALAVSIIKIVDALPDTLTGKHVAGQLLRSGTSPGANYEEARGAESRRDFLHKLGITLKELQESHYWLRVVAGAALVGHDISSVIQEVAEICRIIGKSRVTAQSKSRVSPRG
jgi:four helix bundle protein